jgi:hypothetical protein
LLLGRAAARTALRVAVERAGRAGARARVVAEVSMLWGRERGRGGKKRRNTIVSVRHPAADTTSLHFFVPVVSRVEEC